MSTEYIAHRPMTFRSRAEAFVSAAQQSNGCMREIRNGEFFAFIYPKWSACRKYYTVVRYGPANKRGGYGPCTSHYYAGYGLPDIFRSARQAIAA